MDYMYLICLAATNIAFYLMGKRDGKDEGYTLDEDAQYDIEIYKVDKYYEYKRWEAERSRNADL